MHRVTVSLAALERQAKHRGQDYLKAVRANSVPVRDGVLEIEFDDLLRAAEAHPEQRRSLGDVVASSVAAKAASGCYDASGNLLPGSPCAQKRGAAAAGG